MNGITSKNASALYLNCTNYKNIH